MSTDGSAFSDSRKISNKCLEGMGKREFFVTRWKFKSGSNEPLEFQVSGVIKYLGVAQTSHPVDLLSHPLIQLR